MNICAAHCPRKDFHYVGFNQDCGCFVVGTDSGLRIFNSDPVRDQHHQAEFPQVSVVIAEMLFRCNYVAFVTADERKKVKVFDESKGRAVIELSMEKEVMAIRLRRDRIVVVLHDHVKVFTFTSAPSCLLTFATCPNPKGLCALSPASGNSLLVYPSTLLGCANVANLDPSEGEEDKDKTIAAHEKNLSCLTINVQGTRLATASDKGTLIRLFDTSNGQLLTEFRRGSQPATIFSISFSSDSSLLCASSSHGTVHIFAIDKDAKKGSSKQSAAASFLQASTNKLLPKYFSSEWSFSRIEIPGGSPCICAFGGSNNSVIVICSDGSYHKFVYNEGTYVRDMYKMILEK